MLGPLVGLGLSLVLCATAAAPPASATLAAAAAAPTALGAAPRAPAPAAAAPAAAAPAAAGRAAAAPARLLPAWNGGIDLYRKGVFTTQKGWLWCTAAGVQIVRNIVERDEDHSRAAQGRYFDWMRTKNHYDLPTSAGVDPRGWTAGLRHFVDDRYRLVASRTFGAALRSAVTRLRQTQLPVALTVSNGGHGWILTGFEATADPLLTDDFKVTSVRVVGPLFGLQSRNGYDMRPDTELTTAQLRRYFTPWHYEPLPMMWDGKYVSIQPRPKDDARPIAWARWGAVLAGALLGYRPAT
jgi:hypothetical protein